MPLPVYSKKAGKGNAGRIKRKRPPKKTAISLHNGPQWEERMVGRVAVWMLEGIREPAALLGKVSLAFPLAPVSLGDCKRWQKAVLTRWEAEGSKSEPQAARGEALASLEHLTRILWKEYHSIPSSKLKDRAKIYQLILDVSERWCRLHGVQEGVPGAVSEGSEEIMTRMRQQKEMAEMMGRFADIVARQRKMKANSGGDED